MLAHSDGSQFGFTAEAHSTWLVRCGGYPTPQMMWLWMWNMEDMTHPSPKWCNFRCEIWRIPTPHWCDWMGNVEDPTLPLPHHQSRVDVMCAMWRTLPPLAIESWSYMCNVEDPSPHWCDFFWMWNAEDMTHPSPKWCNFGGEIWRIATPHWCDCLDVKCGGSHSLLPPSVVESWSYMCNVEYPSPLLMCLCLDVKCGGNPPTMWL